MFNTKKLVLGAVEPNRDKSKCPAIMLAANRIARVPGRIKFLIDSIHTINGISGPGVPWGTRCLNICSVIFSHPKSIKLTHRGRAKVRVMVACLDAVNT
jgi:hypothetical protein